MRYVYICLGSNQGDRLVNLNRARSKMEQKAIKILKSSSVYLTPPWGDITQDDYLNQVIEVETDFGPHELLIVLQEIEHKMGRKERGRWTSRIIDLDIIAYGNEIIEKPELKIPHPLMTERGFVLVPLCEIAPDFIHPISKKSIKEMLGEVDRNGITIYRD